jgi:predicted DNA-binding transcriptional regulator YafY
MLRQEERIIRLDQLLRNQNRTTAQYLADELEVSERTIRADITFLRDRLHAPILQSKSLGYYYEDPSWRLSTYPLTQGELFALTLGARMLNAYSGTAYRHELESAIARLSERLPEKNWVDLQRLSEEHLLFRSGAAIDLDPAIWHGLENACHRQQSVLMTYFTASRNVESDRIFDPYLLHIYRGTNPYVIGYCHNRKMIRWFRVDRIRKLEPKMDSFVCDPNFDRAQYLDQIFQCEVGDGSVDVRIEFDSATAPYIRERRWHPSQELVEQANGSVMLTMTVSGLNDIKRWVLSYGKGARVLSPPELVKIVCEDLSEMIRHYTTTGFGG